MLVSGSPPPQERGEDDGAAGRGGWGGRGCQGGGGCGGSLSFYSMPCTLLLSNLFRLRFLPPMGQ